MACGVAWVERLTPLSEANQACHRCLVPGCMKLWDTPVTPRAVRLHVASVHTGMQLRWLHERPRLTEEEQLAHVRESNKQHMKRKRSGGVNDLGQGGQMSSKSSTRGPSALAPMTPPMAAAGHNWNVMGFAPASLPPFTPPPFCLPVGPPFCPPFGFSIQPGPQAAAHLLSPGLLPPLATAGLLPPPAMACLPPPTTPCPPPPPAACKAIHPHRPRRTTDRQGVPRARTRGVPSKEALAKDPDGASLLGSFFCDPSSTAITARYVRERNVIVGAAVQEGGVVDGISVACSYEAWIRGPGTYAGDEPIVLCGNRQDDVPVALRVAILWLRHNLPDVWTRLRCPGPLITDSYGGELPPMFVEHRPLEHVLEGMSMSLALALAMVSRITGCPARKGVGVTASLDISGRLCRVMSVESKAKAMREAGVTTIICARGSEHPLLVTGMAYEIHRHILDVLPLALLPHPENPATPVANFAGYKAGWLGRTTTLAFATAAGSDGVAVKANMDTVFGALQVVECLVRLGREELRVEVLQEPEGGDGTGTEDLATSSVSYVINALSAGRLSCEALGSWPLPPGQHLDVIFNPAAGDDSVPSSGLGHAAMTAALISAITGRSARPGTVIVGEHDWQGNLLPTTSASRADARVVEYVAAEVRQIVCHSTAAAKLRSVIRREGSGQLQRQTMTVVGVESMEELIEQALLPLEEGGEEEEEE